MYSVCYMVSWPKLVKGDHKLLKLDQNEKVKKQFEEAGKDCQSRKTKKWNSGTKAVVALNEAKSGLWAKKSQSVKPQKNNTSNPMNKMIKLHGKSHKQKQTYNDKMLIQTEKQTKAMNKIGNNIGLLSMGDDELYMMFKAYVLEKFQPEHRAEDIIEYSVDHKKECATMFKLFERKPDDYDDDRKNRLIQYAFDDWLRS